MSTRAWPEISSALTLDENLAEGYVSRGTLLTDFDWNWPAAEADFHKALELNSNSASAHHWYARHLGGAWPFRGGDEGNQRCRETRSLSTRHSELEGENSLCRTATRRRSLNAARPSISKEISGGPFRFSPRPRSTISNIPKGLRPRKSMWNCRTTVVGRSWSWPTPMPRPGTRPNRNES